MPATSPRFTITVHPETDTALKRLAAAQGRPVASIIREFLEGVTPTLNDLAQALESVKHAEATAVAGLAGSLEEIHEEMRPHVEGILGHLQALGSMVGSAGDERAQRARSESPQPAPAVPSRRRQPPPCNTGVVNG